MLDLRSTYFKYLDKGLYFGGNILLKFTITENGEVTVVDIMHSTTKNAEFDEAIRKQLFVCKWKSIEDENTIESSNTTVTAIFKFQE